LPPLAPAADLERRIRWPLVAVGIFLAMLLGLLAMAIVTLLSPATPIAGLPDDPDARAARELVRGLTPVSGDALRFESALLAADSVARPVTAADAGRIAEATALIEGARARRPRDPRVGICLAHLDLARRRYPKAEAGYRAALYFGAHAPEAHLGLGVTLALEAEVESEALRSRALELQAIAQFAAVRPRDGPWLAALYDRAVLLGQVGRGEEARRWAAEYLRLDPASAWAQRLRRELGN
jgi:tetratricopeptide (TPR) repeat protein